MFYILYTSIGSARCSNKEIANILRKSRQNNLSNSVTGVLVYKNPEFLQYLEGPQDAVVSLYEKIKTDDRHVSVQTVSDGEMGSRVFPNWEMGFANEDDLQPLKWKWDLDKLSLFSLVEELEDSMDLIKTFIGTRNLAQKIPIWFYTQYFGSFA